MSAFELDALVRFRDLPDVYVVLKPPHHAADEDPITYVTIQLQNASAGPITVPVADLEPVGEDIAT